MSWNLYTDISDDNYSILYDPIYPSINAQGFEMAERVLTNSTGEQNDFTKCKKKNSFNTDKVNRVMLENKLAAVDKMTFYIISESPLFAF